VGTVIQARLRRSPGDVERLMDGGVPVRLVKGIYIEPADVGYTGHEEIRDAFKRLLAQLVDGGAEVAIATHDDVLVSYALDLLRRSRLPPARYEFQMLLGVRPEMRRRLVEAGHRVRVYVPFGRDWFAYSIRRLQENPRMAMLIAKAVIWREGNGTISVPPA
jgi:proline dehydrogenase